MASEQVLDVAVRRHIFNSERPFPAVLDGIFGGISQPDIGALFGKLAMSVSYEEFSSLVRLIAGNPVTMGQMTRHLPDAGSYAPVTILIQELPAGSLANVDGDSTYVRIQVLTNAGALDRRKQPPGSR